MNRRMMIIIMRCRRQPDGGTEADTSSLQKATTNGSWSKSCQMVRTSYWLHVN